MRRTGEPFFSFIFYSQNLREPFIVNFLLQVSAAANNSECGLGVAFNSKIGGVRVLDGPITDALEAKALSFNRDHIDIFSASWGPDDDGNTVDGPGTLASRALAEGVKFGRKGKGSIFMWASGNGGKVRNSVICSDYLLTLL